MPCFQSRKQGISCFKKAGHSYLLCTISSLSIDLNVFLVDGFPFYQKYKCLTCLPDCNMLISKRFGSELNKLILT